MDVVWSSAGKQARLSGLWKAEPDIELKAFRFSAKIDTLKLVIRIDRLAKPGALKKVIAQALDESEVFVSACGANNMRAMKSGKGADEWVVTIEDPSRDRVEGVCQAVSGAYGLKDDIGVAQLDMALDARVSGQTKGIANSWDNLNPVFKALRFTLHPEKGFDGGWMKRDHKPLSQRKAEVLGFLKGHGTVKPGTQYWGDHEGTDWYGDGTCKSNKEKRCVGVQWKLYHKETDRKKVLDEKEQSIRLEASIIQKGLSAAGISDCFSLRDLDTFDFSNLSYFFCFSLPCADEEWKGYSVLPPGFMQGCDVVVSYRVMQERVRKVLERYKWV